MTRRRPLVIGTGPERIVIPPEAMEWQFARSAGPGGQHVNRTSSKAVLRFDAVGCPTLPADVRQRLLTREASRLTAEGSLVISSQRHREQPRNVADCIEKLTVILERAAKPPKTRRATRIPRAARAARLESKKHRGATKRLRQRPED